jgi:alkanesulfonate monooxygenase SsuD/methylene tetrahydromethanopterin reductase-like flavin-dependent oxidoreductase (luciferase family)
MTAALEIDRTRGPLYNENRFKLGIFCFNVSQGTTITKAPGTLTPTWQENVRIAQAADRAGWEFLLPLGRWRGLGGEINFNGRSFEVYTWASAIGALTSQIQVFATSHVPIFHPVLSAKQSTTIDHVSGGRFALNLVAGWNEDEIGMFRGQQLDHEERYVAADEWMTLVKRLWTEEDEFDFEGKYYQVKKAYAMPKPVQKPYPVVVNAGQSATGRRFSAKHVDFSFQSSAQLEALKALIDDTKTIARTEYNREVGILTQGLVVCRDSEKEVQDYLNYCFEEHADWPAAENLIRILIGGGSQSQTPQERWRTQRQIPGWIGHRLLGTPEQIVERMQQLSEIGVDGIALHWVDFEAGIEQFNQRILPLMVQAGLRKR